MNSNERMILARQQYKARKRAKLHSDLAQLFVLICLMMFCFALSDCLKENKHYESKIISFNTEEGK